MKRPLKIAIIGCGMISDTHVQEIRKIPGTNIMAVCDQEPLMAEQLAERYDIPRYCSNLQEILTDCHPDVVHILTPPATHMTLSLTALDAGCNVLLEKPFMLTVHEAKRVIEKAQNVKRRITVNHFHNFSPPAVTLRNLFSQGILGDIIHIESYYGYNLKSPVAQALLNDAGSWVYHLPGKLMQNNISHLIAQITEFIPDESPKVIAYGNRLSNELKRIAHPYVHDELRVLITGENTSAYGTFSANIRPLQHFMTLYGSKHTVSVDYDSGTIVFKHRPRIPGSPGKLLSPVNYARQYLLEASKNLIQFTRSRFHYYTGMDTLLRLFYNCIKNDIEVPIPYAEIIKTHKIMDKIIQQINLKEA